MWSHVRSQTSHKQAALFHTHAKLHCMCATVVNVLIAQTNFFIALYSQLGFIFTLYPQRQSSDLISWSYQFTCNFQLTLNKTFNFIYLILASHMDTSHFQNHCFCPFSQDQLLQDNNCLKCNYESNYWADDKVSEICPIKICPVQSLDSETALRSTILGQGKFSAKVIFQLNIRTCQLRQSHHFSSSFEKSLSLIGLLLEVTPLAVLSMDNMNYFKSG